MNCKKNQYMTAMTFHTCTINDRVYRYSMSTFLILEWLQGT